MTRTQIFLDPDLHRSLTAAAANAGKTLSQVIRERLRRSIEAGEAIDSLAAVDRAFGAWAARDDLPETRSYVRALRKSTRARRHGFAR